MKTVTPLTTCNYTAFNNISLSHLVIHHSDFHSITLSLLHSITLSLSHSVTYTFGTGKSNPITHTFTFLLLLLFCSITPTFTLSHLPSSFHHYLIILSLHHSRLTHHSIILLVLNSLIPSHSFQYSITPSVHHSITISSLFTPSLSLTPISLTH